MKDRPESLDVALRSAQQQETVEATQRRLHREKLRPETLALEQTDDDAPQANSTYHRESEPGRPRRDAQLETLSKQVQHLTEELARLQGRRTGQRDRQRRQGVVCWRCGE